MAVSVDQITDSISRVEEIFLEAVTGSVTMSLVKQIAGSREKFAMVELSTDADIIQAYATAPAEAGTAAVSDVEFTIDKKSINLPIPYSLFENTKWKDAIAGGNFHSMGVPQELQVAMVENIVDKAQATVESELWNSNDGATGSPAATINGFIKIINDKLTAASLTAQILSAATVTTDSTLIQGILDDMVEAVPVALLNDRANVSFNMSGATQYAYMRSLETQNAAVLDQSAAMFGGFKINVIPNLNPRTIVLGKVDNLAVGTPSNPNDMIDLDVIDQKENLKNQANIFGNFGYGAGAVTTDWVTFEDTTV